MKDLTKFEIVTRNTNTGVESLWSYPLPEDGNALPDDLAKIAWSFITNYPFFGGYVKSRSKRQLQTLIKYAYQASLRVEEGRPVRFQLLFNLDPQQITTSFKEPR